MLSTMAVSGTVPSKRQQRFDPRPMAKWARRITLLVAVVGVAWFLLKFDTRWVPPGMTTNPDIPPGSWVIVDRWASGLRVGSDVFIETPHGVLLSRVSRLSEDEVEITHPNQRSGWVDSKVFGPLPRANVQATVVVVFRPDENERGR